MKAITVRSLATEDVPCDASPSPSVQRGRNTNGSRLVLAACLLGLATTEHVALARSVRQPAPMHVEKEPPQDEAARRKSYEEGMVYATLAVAEHDPALFESAYWAFRAALLVRKDPQVLWNIAVMEVETERWEDARRHFAELDLLEHVADDAHHCHHGEYATYMARVSRAIAEREAPQPESPAAAVPPLVAPLPPLYGARADAHESAARTAQVASHSQARARITLGLAATSALLVFGSIYWKTESDREASHAAETRSTQPDGACQDTRASGCAALSDNVRAANRDRALSIASATLGGLSAAGAVATWILLGPPKEAGGGEVSLPVPFVGPTLVGAEWHIRF